MRRVGYDRTFLLLGRLEGWFRRCVSMNDKGEGGMIWEVEKRPNMCIA